MSYAREYKLEEHRDNPLIAVVDDFLKALSFDKEVHSVDFEETFDSRFRTKDAYYPSNPLHWKQYGVTVRFYHPTPLGNTLYLLVELETLGYAITCMRFEPGWRKSE